MRNNLKKTFLLLPTLTLAFLSCAPRYTAYSSKPDSELSCSEIRSQLLQAQSIKEEAQTNKGLSGQNVAWAIFFWPGIFLNEANNSKVIQLANERINTLNALYTAKNCKNK